MHTESKREEVPDPHRNFLLLECWFWFYHLLVFVLAAVILSQVIRSYQTTQNVLSSDAYGHSQETVDFWNMGYIIDIQAVNTNNCPQGYEPLIKLGWSGTNEGCSCKTIVNSHQITYVMMGKCSSQLISYNCTNVPAMSAETLNMWKGGKLICLKRAVSMNFYTSTVTTAPSGLSTLNMTPCAFNTSYQVYTIPGVNCPVTTISNTSLGSAQTSLLLDSTNNLSFNYLSQNGYPIAAVKLTEYQFCSYYSKVNISPNKTGTYILEIQELTNPCSQTDPRVVQFDQLNEEQFYTNNTRVYNLISSLPAYPPPSVSYEFPLGYYSYPTWTYACRTSNTHSLNAATSNILFQSPIQTLKICAGVALPCILFFAGLLRLFFMIRRALELKSRRSFNAVLMTQEQITEQIPNLNIKKSKKREGVLFAIEMILRFGVLVVIIYSIQMLTNTSLWIKQMDNYGCTDTFLMGIFRYYETQIDNVSITLVCAALICSILIAVDILFFIIRFTHGDLHFKQIIEEEPIANSNEFDVVLQKQIDVERQMADSSDIILNPKEDQLKIYELDFIGDNGGQTKQNFYALENSNEYTLVKKKKKKKVPIGKRRKNLFKDDE